MKRHIKSGAITRAIAGAVSIGISLILALVLAGCSNPLNPIDKNVPASASGKGAVQVSVSDGAVRTLLPDPAGLAYYTLAFTKDTQTVNGVISSGVSGSFELDAGTWNLTAKGFLSESAASDAGNALASGSVSGIEVTAGETTPATVPMAFTNGETGTGTLSYSVTFPADTTSATLSAVKIGGDTTTKNLLSSSDGNTVSDGDPKTATGAPSLYAGYYQITVTLSKDDGATRAIKTEIAHIGNGLSTELAYAFTSADFFNTYTVSGTIAKSSGDTALSNAAVTLKSSRGTDIGTITQPDVSGAYSITGVPAAGDYTLTVSLAGYETKSVTVSGTSSAITQDVALSRVINVTSSADSGENTLRWALTQVTATTSAPATDLIKVDNAVAEAGITLASSLSISTSGDALYLVIEGNGVTVSGNNTYRILTIGSSSIATRVTIRRVRFHEGKTASYGGAIYNYGTVSLESCIFSGNQASSGGAIFSNSGTLTVKGSTFYNNSATSYIGAIERNNGNVSLTGNLFYGNTAPSRSVTYSTTSYGYNVSDKASGTDSTTGSGWTFATGDVQVTTPPLAPASFKLLSGTDAVGRLPSTLPAGYPATDFYGATISGGGNAGAVQATAAAGYILSYTASGAGTVAVTSGTPNDDSLYTGSVTLTASNGAGTFDHWVKDGAEAGSANPLTFTINAHTTVQAVFVREVSVTTNTGTASGSLPYAITNALDGDTIVIQSGVGTITLTAAMSLTKSVTIEGNGVTVSGNNAVKILTIGSSSVNPTVTIRGVRFDQGRANDYAGGIRNYGITTLESCIFSNNSVSSSSGQAGAIQNDKTLTVTGCTFYNNSVPDNTYGGAAIYQESSAVLTITGNLFYGNTHNNYPVIKNAGTVTSGGYNVVDKASGTGAGASGWVFVATDKTFSDLSISDAPIDTTSTKPTSANLSALQIVPTETDGFPATDFGGATRSDTASESKTAAGAWSTGE
jgi:hypothetical protein